MCHCSKGVMRRGRYLDKFIDPDALHDRLSGQSVSDLSKHSHPSMAICGNDSLFNDYILQATLVSLELRESRPMMACRSGCTDLTESGNQPER